jgi:hypothetical protein
MNLPRVAHASRLTSFAPQHEVGVFATSYQPHPEVPAQRASKGAPQVIQP